MKCSYCGAEIKEPWLFCMQCGTKLPEETAEEPVEQEAPVQNAFPWDDFNPEPVIQEPVPQQPETGAPTTVLRQERNPVVLASKGPKVAFDPNKFEFAPVERDEPISKGVTSWELVPADTKVPKIQLPIKRGLGKMIFLGMLTLGIYPTVIYSKIITELNILASRHDGKRTMTFFGMLMLSPVTFGIYAYVWFHKLCARIGDELQRRGIDYKFGPSHFWLWNILGSFILVGPFIFLHKLMKSMNLLNKDFNEKG